MSDVGRYRKAYPRIWRHPGFRELSRDEQRLVLYLLYGPPANRIGLFHLSVFTAAEDLDSTPETIRKGLANITVTFGWGFDADARVFYIPTWWKWNQPENPNVIKGSLKDLNEVPPCGLVEAFANNVDHLSDISAKDGPTIRATFMEGIHQRLRKPSRNQKQYSGTETKQDREHSAQSAEALSGNRVEPSPESKDKNGSDGQLLAIARETLKNTNPNQSIEDLIDAFCACSQGTPYTRASARKALHVALSERRVS